MHAKENKWMLVSLSHMSTYTTYSITMQLWKNLGSCVHACLVRFLTVALGGGGKYAVYPISELWMDYLSHFEWIKRNCRWLTPSFKKNMYGECNLKSKFSVSKFVDISQYCYWVKITLALISWLWRFLKAYRG